MKIRKHSGFTLIELLVVISIIAIIAALAMPAFSSFMLKGRMADQLNNGRQIYLSMRNYASETSHGGIFPAYKDPDDATTLVQNSNEAFEILLPRYLDDKKIFTNKNSAWCKTTTKSENTANKVQPGENDWVYVRGLKDALAAPRQRLRSRHDDLHQGPEQAGWRLEGCQCDRGLGWRQRRAGRDQGPGRIVLREALRQAERERLREGFRLARR